MGSGHVFVVRGRLESIDADIVVVPTDQAFMVEDTWSGVWSGEERPTKPAGWSGGAAMPSTDDPPGDRPWIWFIDVARRGVEPPQRTIDRITDGLRVVLDRAQKLPSTRGTPLVAVTTLGVGRGGLGEVRGQVITNLLDRLGADTAEFGVDVAIVAFNAADHAAFQHVRRTSSTPPFLPKDLDDEARSVAGRVDRREIALFVGAGVSMSAGLPSWDGLLARLKEYLDTPVTDSGMNPLDLAQLISREVKDFGPKVADSLRHSSRAGLSHLLLSALDCEEVVTTNFDLLYEVAAAARPDGRLTVLPYEHLNGRGPWLLKMHGDIEHPGSIVLSRSDFVRYGRAHGLSGAVVQALMSSRHLLVVGASLTDDNFLRLAYEVDDFLTANDRPHRLLGTVLTAGHDPDRERLYKDMFRFVSVLPAGSGDDVGRAFALFLDALAMYASSDSSYLLDERYEFLLSEQDRALAGKTRELAAALGRTEGDSGPWRGLRSLLRDLGGRPE